MPGDWVFVCFFAIMILLALLDMWLVWDAGRARRYYSIRFLVFPLLIIFPLSLNSFVLIKKTIDAFLVALLSILLFIRLVSPTTWVVYLLFFFAACIPVWVFTRERARKIPEQDSISEPFQNIGSMLTPSLVLKSILFTVILGVVTGLIVILLVFSMYSK